MGICEWRGHQSVMKSLPVHIIEGCQQTDKTIDLRDESLPFTQSAAPPIFRIEITAVCISVPLNKVDRIVGLDNDVPVRGHKPFGQQPAFREQDRFSQAIESPDHIGLRPVKDFVMRSYANMIGFSHRPPMTDSDYIGLSARLVERSLTT